MHEFFISLVPSHLDRVLMATGAGIGAAWSFLFGSIPQDALIWCLIFLAADYATGTWAAAVQHCWSSAVGYKGLLKKLVILGCVALSNGLDAVFGTSLVVTMSIGAVCVTELGSVLENLTAAGYGSAIPQIIRDVLAVAKAKEEEMRRKRLESMK